MKLKIWHISDTHGHHNMLQVPECDIVIFSGDESNNKNPYLNLPEFSEFIDWFKKLNIKHKIFVAGNHSSAIAKGLIEKVEFGNNGIIYLENEYVHIEGLEIFGSPITPTFNDWYFMKSRDKLDKLWKNVSDTVDIMITHGPPKYILDLSENKEHKLEFCGDSALYKHVVYRIKPVLHCFGHIHNYKSIENSGVKKLMNCNTVFSNAAVVEDGKFGKILGNGNMFKIDTESKKVVIL